MGDCREKESHSDDDDDDNDEHAREIETLGERCTAEGVVNDDDDEDTFDVDEIPPPSDEGVGVMKPSLGAYSPPLLDEDAKEKDTASDDRVADDESLLSLRRDHLPPSLKEGIEISSSRESSRSGIFFRYSWKIASRNGRCVVGFCVHFRV